MNLEEENDDNIKILSPTINGGVGVSPTIDGGMGVSPINDKIALHFLNACGFICEDIKDLDGIIVPRETLLNDVIYDKLKKDIPKLKAILSSTTYTSMQKDADKSQKWPLINLIRQILRKYDYQLNPKRVCDGYTKDGIKKYKRLFEVRQGAKPLANPDIKPITNPEI